jgi:tetrahydromethanopterin S-methyltransferase subunit A
MDYARFQTELAVADHSFVAVRPSELGLAAVLNAVEGLEANLLTSKMQARFVRNIEKYAEMCVDDVERTQTRLSLMMVNLFKAEAAEYIQNAIQEVMNEDGEEYDEEEKARIALKRRHSPTTVVKSR